MGAYIHNRLKALFHAVVLCTWAEWICFVFCYRCRIRAFSVCFACMDRLIRCTSFEFVDVPGRLTFYEIKIARRARDCNGKRLYCH